MCAYILRFGGVRPAAHGGRPQTQLSNGVIARQSEISAQQNIGGIEAAAENVGLIRKLGEKSRLLLRRTTAIVRS